MKLTKTTPLISGFLIALMVSVNTTLSKIIGETYSVFIIHLTGLTILLALSVLRKNRVKFYRDIPLWIYFGGGLGIFIVLFNNITIQKVGVSLALSLGIAGQIITSVLLEHIGFLDSVQNKFSIAKLPGVILIFLGSIIIIL